MKKEITLYLEVENPILQGVLTDHLKNICQVIHEEEDEVTKAMNKSILLNQEFKMNIGLAYTPSKQEIKTNISTSVAIKGDTVTIFQHPDQTSFKFAED